MVELSHLLPAKGLPPNAKRPVLIQGLVIRIINGFIVDMNGIFQEISPSCLFLLVLIKPLDFQ